MKLTKESNKLMAFFVENNCLLPHQQTTKTDTILKKIYEDIKTGVSYINDLKLKNGDFFYKLKLDHITNISQIPKPSTFPPNAFPPEVRKHIDELSIGLLTYNFHITDIRNLNYFILYK